MRKNDRQEEIIRILQKDLTKNKITIRHLAEILEISPITIRRDVNILEQNGIIKRSHGAVSLSSQPNISYPDNKTRSQQHNDIKQFIASKASLLVEHNMIIFLDNSTSVSAMIPFLQKKKVQVVTNSFDVLKSLEPYPIQAICLGGRFDRHYGMFIHPNIPYQLETYQFDFAFLGTTGLSKHGTMEVNDYTAALKMEISKRSKNVIILCDHTKLIPSQGFLSIRHADITKIITNGQGDLWQDTDIFSKIEVIIP